MDFFLILNTNLIFLETMKASLADNVNHFSSSYEEVMTRPLSDYWWLGLFIRDWLALRPLRKSQNLALNCFNATLLSLRPNSTSTYLQRSKLCFRCSLDVRRTLKGCLGHLPCKTFVMSSVTLKRNSRQVNTTWIVTAAWLRKHLILICNYFVLCRIIYMYKRIYYI